MAEELKEFKREDRYIVLKRKHLATLPNELQYRLKPALEDAAQLMPPLECVVVESDWPEHETIWRMIEARVNGSAQLPNQGGEAVAPSIEAAYAMGAKGGASNDAERIAFESWMAGHCWALCATWDGKGYKCESEQGGQFNPAAAMTRRLWAAWRDRAALAATHPADQVAEGVVVSRELLDLAYQAVHALAGMGIDGYTEGRCAELRQLLAKSEGVKK